MFVSLTDFTVKPYIIPSTADSEEGVSLFIVNKEEGLLEDLLGKHFYDIMVEGIENLPADWDVATDYDVDEEVVYGADIFKSLQTPNLNKNPLDEPTYWEKQAVNKWLRLKVGDSFKNSNGIIEYWKGMKDMLVPAVHSEYLEKYSYNESPLGTSTSTSENSEMQSPRVVIEKHWNIYNEISKTLYNFLISETAIAWFEDLVIADDSGYSSFLQYLTLNFSCPGDLNFLDL